MAQINIYTQQITVGQDDIDMQHRVSNLRYVAWMQDLAMAHSAACGWSMERYESIGQGWVVHQHTITYKRPAFLGDVITAATWLASYASRRSLRRYAFWNAKGSDIYAGIIALDADFENNVIGKDLGALRETTVSGYYSAGGAGDKKLIYRTELIKRYPPYPVYKGEKYFSLSYKYLLCDQDYKMLVLNDIVCNVEYQPNGSSSTMLSQYRNNPNGWTDWRKIKMKYSANKKATFKNCIHYVSSAFIAHRKRFIKESPEKALTLLALPFGLALNLYIKMKTR